MKRKLIGIALTLGFSLASSAVVKKPSICPTWSGAEPGVWTMDYETALAKAQTDGVYTLMYYSGLWWCPHCQALEETALSTQAWADYVQANGFYETVLDFPNRAGTGNWCWLWETNYVEEAGLTMDAAKAEVESRYMVQDSYSVPGATRQYNVPTWDAAAQAWDKSKLIDYGKIGYPTLLLVRPDGKVAGRFSVGMTVASLDYVTNRIEQLKSADDWDESDDYRATATELELPICEDFQVCHGDHTISLVDRSDWYRIAITNAVGKYWEFTFAPNGDIPAEAVHVLIYKGDGTAPVLDAVVTPGDGASVGFVPEEADDYYLCVSAADAANNHVIGYSLSYQYMLEPAATVGFASTAVSVQSDSAYVTLEVTIADASKASEVIVDYEATDGTATNGVDYVLESGAIKWAAGQAKKTKKLKIPLVATDAWKGDRTFTVSLRPQKHCALAEVISTCKVTIKEAIARKAGKLTFSKTASQTLMTLVEGKSRSFDVSRSGGTDGVVKAAIKVVENGVSLGVVTNIVWAHGDADKKKFILMPAVQEGVQDDFNGTITLTAKSGASAGSYTTIKYVRRDAQVVTPFAQYNADTLGGAASISGDGWFYGYRPDETENPVLRSVELTKSTKLSVAVAGPAVFSLSAECLSNATMTVKLDKALLTNRVDGTALKIAIPDGSHTILLTAKKGDAGSYVTAGWKTTKLSSYKMTPSLPLKATWVRLSDSLVVKATSKKAGGQPVSLAVETMVGASTSALSAMGASEGRFLSGDGTYVYPADGAEKETFMTALAPFEGKMVYWRMDTVFTDEWGNRAVQKGTASKFEVVAAGAVAADLSDVGLPPGWSADADAVKVTLPDLTVGVAVPPDALPLADMPAGATPLVAVANGSLPAGVAVKATAAGIYLEGVPTTASDAATFDVHLSSKKGKTTKSGASVRFVVAVRALGDVAATYNGGRTAEEVAERGVATVSVSSKGKVSGSFTLDGKTYSVAADSLSARTNSTFYLSGVGAVNGKTVKIVNMEFNIVDSGRMCDAFALFENGARYDLFRNAWKTNPAKKEIAKMAGYYTAALPVAASNPDGVAPMGTGYLTATIKTSGAVAYAGIDSLGKAFSGSTTLLRRPDCCAVSPWNYAFYMETKPEGSTAAGAGLWGLVLLTESSEPGKYILSSDGGMVTLVNLTPKSVYGYSRWTNTLDVVGGSYDVSAPFAGDASFWRLGYELAAFDNWSGRGGASAYVLASAPKDVFLIATSVKNATATKNDWSFALKSFNAKTGIFSAGFNFIYAKGATQKKKAVTAQGVFVQRCATGKSFWSGLYTLPETGTCTTSAGTVKTFDVATPFPLELLELDW